MKKIVKTAFLMAAGAFWVAGGAFGQSLPQTIEVPVTFYDFRSDRSNPEFEQPHGKGNNDGLWTGMVATTLDGDNKPQIGSAPYRNLGITQWFRDWNTYTAGPYSKGKNTAPQYDPAPARRTLYNNEWGATVTIVNQLANVGHDTSFKNIVIPGELTFTLTNQTTGMYRYNNNSFFPLDGRGFGNEWQVTGGNGQGEAKSPSDHNFAFTMEMVFPFVVKEGMTFNFTGDDDLWVFIDKQLVLDLGGIHEAQNGNFNVTSVLNGAFKVGESRTLRVFYAERHSSASNLRVETNIVAPPSSINIDRTSNGGGNIIGSNVSKPADEKVTLYSVVYDENGVVMNPGQYDCNHVTWTITKPDGKTETKTGCSIEVADSISGSLTVRVVYDNKKDPAVTKSVGMNVNALAPAFVRIQLKDSTMTVRAHGEDVYFKPTDASLTVYAVLYDKYGNRVGLANAKSGGTNDWSAASAASWISDDPTVATTSGSGGSVTVKKEFAGEGTEAKLIVTYRVCGGTLGAGVCKDLADTVGVGSKSVGAIAVGPPFVPGVTGALDQYKKDPAVGAKVEEFYKPVIENSGGNGRKDKGILIGVDAPKPLEQVGKGAGAAARYGKVMIYDAVGNVVMTDALIQAAGAARSYGYIWDGKNQNGRNVGPGTYLVRITGRDADQKPFFVQRKVGVTTAK